MWLILIAVLVGLGLYCLYDFLRVRQIVRRFVGQAPSQTGEFYRGKKTNKKLSFLLIGDSVAAGTGIEKIEDSLGGRLADALADKYYVHLVNKAWPGAKLDNLAQANYTKNWDLIVIVAGSNDLIVPTPRTRSEKSLNALLDIITTHSKTVLLVGPGDIASIRAYPFWLKIGMAKKQRRLSDMMAAAATKHGILYADPLSYNVALSPDFFAEDGLHPNAAGHKLWFRIIWDQLSGKF